MINSTSERSNTGYKGISLRERSGKYEVKVEFPYNKLYKRKHKFQVGTFNTIEEAVRARQQFIKSLF